MRNRFIRFTLAEEAIALCFLSWAYSLNPANRDFFVALLFVFVYGASLAISNTLIYLLNNNVVWSQLRLIEKVLRIAASAIMTDAVFYVIYSLVHGLTGLWLSSETPSGIATVAGIGLGIAALIGVVTSSSHNKPDDANPQQS